MKVALLIGVSTYQPGLSPLPSAEKDVQELQRVLQTPEMGGFEQVKSIVNPDPLQMQREIEGLFGDRNKDDLVLLFFSGHGIKDDSGKLYFTTSLTQKTQKGELIKSTAVPASFVHEIMGNSRSKRQVLMLDCCFSGAFAEGMTAKDDGRVDVLQQLGGEGRAVLTSSTSSQYSFEQQGSDLSVYTRYLIEGIETGAADQDNDGDVSIDELHEYAKRKVQETAPAMKPEIYAIKEGFKIKLARALVGDPKLRYRREVEQIAERGEISEIYRMALDARCQQLRLTAEEAEAIETEVLKPYRTYRTHLRQYGQTLVQAVAREFPLSEATRSELDFLKRALGLRNEDIRPVEERVLASRSGSSTNQTSPGHEMPVAPAASSNNLGHLTPLSASSNSNVLPEVPLTVPLRPEVPQPVTQTSPFQGGAIAHPVTQPRQPEPAATHSTATSSTPPSRKSRRFLNLMVAVALGATSIGGYFVLSGMSLHQPMGQASTSAGTTLQRAIQEYNLGNFERAIALLQSVPQDSPDFALAQSTIAQWQQDWTSDQTVLAEVQNDLDVAWDINGAKQKRQVIKHPALQQQADALIAQFEQRAQKPKTVQTTIFVPVVHSPQDPTTVHPPVEDPITEVLPFEPDVTDSDPGANPENPELNPNTPGNGEHSGSTPGHPGSPEPAAPSVVSAAPEF